MTIERTFLVTLRMDDDFAAPQEDDVNIVHKILRELVDEGLGPVHGVAAVERPSDNEELRVHAERVAARLRSRVMQAERRLTEEATSIVAQTLGNDATWYRRVVNYVNRMVSQAVAQQADAEGAAIALREMVAEWLQRELPASADSNDEAMIYMRGEAIDFIMDNVDWGDVAAEFDDLFDEVVEEEGTFIEEHED